MRKTQEGGRRGGEGEGGERFTKGGTKVSFGIIIAHISTFFNLSTFGSSDYSPIMKGWLQQRKRSHSKSQESDIDQTSYIELYCLQHHDMC